MQINKSGVGSCLLKLFGIGRAGFVHRVCIACFNRLVTDWANLTDACGSAAHVPALLDRFEADPAAIWSELMNHLCPRLYGAFSAAFAALPRLAKLAQLDQANRSLILMAAGAITVSARVPCGTGDVDVFGLYSDAIGELHRLADEQLSLERDPGKYIDMFQSLLSFEAGMVWHRLENDFADREYVLYCPACWAEVFIYVGSVGNVTSRDALPRDGAESLPLLPATVGDLNALAKRIYDRALEDDHTSLGEALLYLTGDAMCPECLNVFRMAEKLVPALRP